MLICDLKSMYWLFTQTSPLALVVTIYGLCSFSKVFYLFLCDSHLFVFLIKIHLLFDAQIVVPQLLDFRGCTGQRNWNKKKCAGKCKFLCFCARNFHHGNLMSLFCSSQLTWDNGSSLKIFLRSFTNIRKKFCEGL